MMRALVAYGTREDTATVASFVHGVAHDHGWKVDLRRCRDVPPEESLSAYNAIVVAAPMHSRRYDEEVIGFVRGHRGALDSVPAAFLSVGLIPTLPKRFRAAATAAALATLKRETGWQPSRALMVGGAVLYRQYRPLLRQGMRLFMALVGGPADTRRDHDLTDWASLKSFTLELLACAERSPTRQRNADMAT